PRLEFAADAFFLDGCAPQRNPEMWSPHLLAQLAARAARGATAATWAAVGARRRPLASVGFQVEISAGSGAKREMTVARLAGAGNDRGNRSVCGVKPSSALVIGAGVAGAGVARGLARRGWQVSVVSPPAGPGATDMLASANV